MACGGLKDPGGACQARRAQGRRRSGPARAEQSGVAPVRVVGRDEVREAFPGLSAPGLLGTRPPFHAKPWFSLCTQVLWIFLQEVLLSLSRKDE